MISKAPIVRALSRIRRQIARQEEQSEKDEDHYDQLTLLPCRIQTITGTGKNPRSQHACGANRNYP